MRFHCTPACGNPNSRSPIAGGASSRRTFAGSARPQRIRRRPRWTISRATSSICWIFFVEGAVIGGLSLGGYVTFAVLRHAPAYFRGIVLADTRPQADPPEAIENRKKMQALVREKGPAAVADQMLPKLLGETTHRTQPAVVDQVRQMILGNSPEGISGALTAMMTRPESESLLSSIRCPALVIVGAEDALTPPALSEGMHQKIAGSTLVTIPEAGHLANLERPAEFNDALGRFLDHQV
jgi:3-oxoadipate enol-lactonase